MKHGDDELHFFYDAQNKPALVVYNGSVYTYLYNLQGDVIALLDNSGNVVVEYQYDAWGKIISKTGAMASTLGTVQPFRYRGYVYDEETGLYYLRSRYYNPSICRFVNMDCVLNKGILMLNQQAYCSNKPVANSDKSGMSWCDDIGDLFVYIFNENQEIALSNAYSEQVAWSAINNNITDSFLHAFDLIKWIYEENNSIIRYNDQTEQKAAQFVSKALFDIFVMTVEQNQRVEQYNMMNKMKLIQYAMNNPDDAMLFASVGLTLLGAAELCLSPIFPPFAILGKISFAGTVGLTLYQLADFSQKKKRKNE